MTNQPTNGQAQEGRDADATQRIPGVTPPAAPTSAANGGQRASHAATFELGGAPAASNSSSEEVLIRKKRRRNTKRKRALRIAAIVVLVIALLVGGAAFAVWHAIKSGEEAMHQTVDAEDIQTADNSVSYDEGRTVQYNGRTYKLNENMVSIVVMGYDQRDEDAVAGRAGQADAVMVMALDTSTGKATAIGVPRDSMVDVTKAVGSAYLGQDKMQLCLAYSYGDNADTSAQYVTTAVSRVLYNMPMSYYFALDLQGVGPLNDAIGGVVIDPLQTIPGTDIVEGDQTILFGDDALKYVQWRDTSELTSPLDRQDRQVQYVKAFASKALNQAKGNVGAMIDLFNTAGDYSVTNLGLNEFSYLASTVVSHGISSLDVVTLQGEARQGENYMEYYLDQDSVYQTVLDVYYQQVD